MIRQRKPTKRADQTLLTLFIIRQLFGIIVLGTITIFAFQVPDKRLTWFLVPMVLLYLGYSVSVVVKGLKKYRQRYGNNT